MAKSASQRPVKDWSGRQWVATWHDGETQREVRAPCFRETWTQYDVEIADRENVPPERRRGLIEP